MYSQPPQERRRRAPSAGGLTNCNPKVQELASFFNLLHTQKSKSMSRLLIKHNPFRRSTKRGKIPVESMARKDFPEGVTFQDYSFVNVPIPEKELREIDAKHRVNDGMISAVGLFRRLRDEYVDELWQPEKDEQERQQQLRQQKIGLVLAAIILVYMDLLKPVIPPIFRLIVTIRHNRRATAAPYAVFDKHDFRNRIVICRALQDKKGDVMTDG